MLGSISTRRVGYALALAAFLAGCGSNGPITTPPQTPTPSPTPKSATPTPTPSPVGQTPSPTPSPTASPVGQTPSPTPTATPTPTPPPPGSLLIEPNPATFAGVDGGGFDYDQTLTITDPVSTTGITFGTCTGTGSVTFGTPTGSGTSWSVVASPVTAGTCTATVQDAGGADIGTFTATINSGSVTVTGHGRH
jgi:predicted small lipoprotein YifL